MKAAFFDFDGTLVYGDSLIAFIRFYFKDKKLKMLIKVLQFSPYFIAYKINVLSNSQAKAKLFKIFFKGENRDNFLKKSKQFSENWIDKNLKTEAWKKLQWHLEEGHRVIIVSASIDTYLLPWTQKNGLALLCTEMDLTTEVISGNWKTSNCYGKEKANRIKGAVDFSRLHFSYAYGDSKGDREMLAMVDRAFYQNS